MTNTEQPDTLEGRLVAYVAGLRARFEALKMQVAGEPAAGLPAISLYDLDSRSLWRLSTDALMLAVEAERLGRLAREAADDRDSAAR